jgi:heme-degrading monooxygenase HmoA
MNQRDYISGETLINHDDPMEILVVSMWQGMKNWLKWKENPERRANETLIERWLTGPTTYESYVFSTSHAQFAK